MGGATGEVPSLAELKGEELAKGSPALVLETDGLWSSEEAIVFGTEANPRGANIILSSSSPEQKTGLAHAIEKGAYTVKVVGSQLILTVTDADFRQSSDTKIGVKVQAAALSGAAPAEEPLTYTVKKGPSILSQAEKEETQSLAAAGGTNTGRSNALIHLLECPMEMEASELSWTENPLHLHLPSFKSPDRAGAVLGNTILIANFLIIHFGIALLIYGHRRMNNNPDASLLGAMGSARFPSYTFFPAMFFYQTTLESAVHVVATEPAAAGKVFAICGILMYNGGVLLLVFYVVHPKVFREEFVDYPASNSLCSKVLRKLVGVGDYSSRDHSFVWRYGLMFHDFWPRAYRFMLVELTFTTVLGIVDGLEMDNRDGCKVQLFVVLLIYVIYTVVLIKTRPYHALANNVASVGAAVSQTATVLCIIVHLFGDNPTSGAATAAFYFLYASIFFLMIKSFLELASAMYDNYMAAKEKLAAPATTKEVPVPFDVVSDASARSVPLLALDTEMENQATKSVASEEFYDMSFLGTGPMVTQASVAERSRRGSAYSDSLSPTASGLSSTHPHSRVTLDDSQKSSKSYRIIGEARGRGSLMESARWKRKGGPTQGGAPMVASQIIQ